MARAVSTNRRRCARKSLPGRFAPSLKVLSPPGALELAPILRPRPRPVDRAPVLEYEPFHSFDLTSREEVVDVVGRITRHHGALTFDGEPFEDLAARDVLRSDGRR